MAAIITALLAVVHHRDPDRFSSSRNANEVRDLDGNDVLRGDASADVLNGSNGVDTAQYSESAAWLTVDI